MWGGVFGFTVMLDFFRAARTPASLILSTDCLIVFRRWSAPFFVKIFKVERRDGGGLAGSLTGVNSDPPRVRDLVPFIAPRGYVRIDLRWVGLASGSTWSTF